MPPWSRLIFLSDRRVLTWLPLADKAKMGAFFFPSGRCVDPDSLKRLNYAAVRLKAERADDLIKAVLILLGLCVPFAFALERLLVGSTSIYRQVAWFTVFFTLTFALLYLTHPAFAIAKTPVIIFLGFAVVVLSGLVIGIIMQKFKQEITLMQGLTVTAHVTDISRFNTIMAAMNISS